ncbi:MAG: hypothetical protein AB1554_03390 [Chloroflexota bacterium]
MANRITAINAHRPRIELGNTVQKQELLRYIADRTGLNEGSVDIVLRELRDGIIFFNRAGRAVKIEGLGTYTPTIGIDGVLDMGYRADSALKNGLNTPGAFTGNIFNRDNIGKTSEELVAMWNAAHPDDPVS